MQGRMSLGPGWETALGESVKLLNIVAKFKSSPQYCFCPDHRNNFVYQSGYL